MLTTIPGVYRNGQIELAERPTGLSGETQVLVTFLAAGPIWPLAESIKRPLPICGLAWRRSPKNGLVLKWPSTTTKMATLSSPKRGAML